MVKYLYSYIKERKLSKGVSYRVKLIDEITNFKKKNPNKKPIIAFDLLACLPMFASHNDSEILCGGRQTECTRKITLLCKKFKDIGCELVFFMDGPMKKDKLPHWLISVNEKYEKHKLVFKEIKNNTPLDKIKSYHILTSYNNNIIRIIKQNGKLIICLDNECDIELAEYATKNNVAGLFTCDTDFLITQGDWPIWSTRHFRFDDFSTVAWNKKMLRRSLNLTRYQLPIFATLAGNDYIQYEIVEPFLNEINKGKTEFIEFRKLAEYIRNEFSDGYPSSDQINKLAEQIYAYHKDKPSAIIKNKDELKQKIFNSLTSYNFKKIRHYEITPSWLKKHVDDTSSTFLYILMKNNPFLIRQNYIDLTNSDIRPFYELCFPIVQRIMGIVFNNMREANVKRTIYYKPSETEPFQEKSIEPEYPSSTLKLPTLIDLLGYGKRIITDKEKFDVLCWVLSAGRKKMNVSDLIEICNSLYFLPSITLTYLVKSMQISVDEADIILLAVHESSKASEEKMNALQPPGVVSERAFLISNVYVQIMYYFISSVIICGLYKYTTFDYYDGYIFHKMYPKYLSMDSNQRKQILEPIQKYRLYVK